MSTEEHPVDGQRSRRWVPVASVPAGEPAAVWDRPASRRSCAVRSTTGYRWSRPPGPPTLENRTRRDWPRASRRWHAVRRAAARPRTGCPPPCRQRSRCRPRRHAPRWGPAGGTRHHDVLDSTGTPASRTAPRSETRREAGSRPSRRATAANQWPASRRGSRRPPGWDQATPVADSRARRCNTALVWICDTRLSVTPRIVPISARVKPSS